MGRSNSATLDALIAQATADCANNSECVTGFYTMLAGNPATPFQAMVLGADVTGDEQIVAVRMRGPSTQRIPILEIPLPTPPPESEGVQWTAAYRRWANTT
jgi:hypothetical protein